MEYLKSDTMSFIFLFILSSLSILYFFIIFIDQGILVIKSHVKKNDIKRIAICDSHVSKCRTLHQHIHHMFKVRTLGA